MQGRLILFVAVAANAQQLNLQPCDNSTAPFASLSWRYTESAFILTSTGQCVSYDAKTTNLVMSACEAGSPLQSFVLDAAGTISNPSTKFCWVRYLAPKPSAPKQPLTPLLNPLPNRTPSSMATPRARGWGFTPVPLRRSGMFSTLMLQPDSLRMARCPRYACRAASCRRPSPRRSKSRSWTWRSPL